MTGPNARSLVRDTWTAWQRPELVQAARALSLAALGSLFLQSAATIDLGYTLRIPHVAAVLAVAVALPSVLAGWLHQPESMRWSAAALLVVYLVAAIVGRETTITGAAHAGGTRDLVYLADLVIGMAFVGLLVELWVGSTKRPTGALALGLGAAAAYAVYQWPAQHYEWFLADVNNTLDSTGLTENSPQGAGLFGWDRVRGTFLEPHFLAAYLSTLIPFALAWGYDGSRRSRQVSMGIVGIALVALALTASASSWFLALTGWLVGLALWSTARGRVRAAGLLGFMLAVLLIVLPVALASPAVLADVTGRTGSDIVATTTFRTETWDQAIGIWSERPVLGYGPGQSAVRLTLERDQSGAGLASAQGLWAASLIDSGVVGASVWLLFLGCAVLRVGVVQFGRPTVAGCAGLAGLVAAVLATEISGDRLDLRVWAVLGVALAASTRRDPCEEQRR